MRNEMHLPGAEAIQNGKEFGRELVSAKRDKGKLSGIDRAIKRCFGVEEGAKKTRPMRIALSRVIGVDWTGRVGVVWSPPVRPATPPVEHYGRRKSPKRHAGSRRDDIDAEYVPIDQVCL